MTRKMKIKTKPKTSKERKQITALRQYSLAQERILQHALRELRDLMVKYGMNFCSVESGNHAAIEVSVNHYAIEARVMAEIDTGELDEAEPMVSLRYQVLNDWKDLS